MFTRFIRLIFFCGYLINLDKAARILGIFPLAAPSHYILGNALMKGLAEAGHDVTMISPYRDETPPKRGTWRDIILADFIDLKRNFEKDSLSQMENLSPLMVTAFHNRMGNSLAEKTLNHTKVQKLIKSGEKFDVVIVGQYINDAFKVLANHFDGHLILFSNTAASSWLNHLVGNPSLPSFHPEMLLNFPKSMSFFQRLENTIFKILIFLNMNWNIYPEQNRFVQKYLPNPVDLSDALYNVSLVLLNSHVSIFNPQPSVPCMVEIGGFHIKPAKKLPNDLQKFLDEADEGVIYFSMGSSLKSSNLPTEKREAILKALGKRKEKVLWKWEDDVLPGQPPNVKLGKWLPQQDILAHPNVKVFITHGGLLSTTETVYHGVPIIAIPIVGDQKMNANTAQEAGYCLVLPFRELSEEKLSQLLTEILRNPKYTENARERSRIMADRQVKPLDNAVYWVEYVIRHNGAKHLRVRYLDLRWYEYYLLDVLGFILMVIFIVFMLVRKIFSYIFIAFSYMCCRTLSKLKAKKN